MTRKFDAIVIGGGQSGGPLAHNLADRGWKVALIEREYLGGSCINYGCTPTKKMIASAKVAQTTRRAAEYGVETGDVKVDLKKIVSLKDELVNDFRKGQQKRVDDRPNITLFHAEATFTGPHIVRVGEEEVESDQIFINTGTSASILPIDGIQDIPYLTNKTILDLTELPEHLLVLGASYIGLEFGQMFRRFGSRVTVIERKGQLVPKEDEDIARTLQEALEAEGMQFLLDTQPVKVGKSENGQIRLAVKTAGGDEIQELSGSHLLMGVGRKPNTAALHLEAAGIAQNKGWIQVNEYLETSVSGIYAMGDVTGGPAFTHISYNDFQIVYHNLFNSEKKSTRNRIIPYALYTDPELGRVGMTEEEARHSGLAIKVGKIPVSGVARAIERGETQGVMKIVVDAVTDQILGASILSPEGGELVQTLMGLMLAKAPWTVFHKAVFIHPTLTEGFFSLMDSIQ